MNEDLLVPVTHLASVVFILFPVMLVVGTNLEYEVDC